MGERLTKSLIFLCRHLGNVEEFIYDSDLVYFRVLLWEHSNIVFEISELDQYLGNGPYDVTID